MDEDGDGVFDLAVFFAGHRHAGPYGLWLKGGATGEIIYDVHLADGLRFKEINLLCGPGGINLDILMALPEGGHNGIEVSLDEGRTWITAFEDLVTRGIDGGVLKCDLTGHVCGSSKFLLKSRMLKRTDHAILAMDSWTIVGIAAPAKP